MYLPFNTLNKDSYPYLDDSKIDKYVPVLYGKIAAVELTCINSNFAADSSSSDAVFRMPDGTSDYGTAYVKVDDVWKTATVESVDYGTGLLTISNGRSDSGSTYTCKIVDCTGYMFDGHCYPRQAMQHWYSTYGGIEYTDSNFSKTEWESELDDIRYQADFGLLLDDYNESEDSKDSYGLDYFNKVIFNISTNAGKMYARVDYTADGKITARLLDLDRTASDTIQSSELFNSGEIAGTTSGDTAYTKIIEKYYYNANDDTYLSLEDNTYEKYVKQAYKIMQSKTDESYLVYQADALVRASNLALMFKFIPIEFTVKVMGRYTARLYDVYTIALQPDNLTANTRQYAGNHDCLVTGVAPDVSNGYTTLKVQIIPDRTASTQQVAIRTDSYTTITREKTATEIVTDDLQTSIDNNLLLTGYLTVPSLSVVADKDGNVTDYSDATGTFTVKYSGEDVTGAGPVYSVVSQTGCTGEIDETTGVYAITALSADVGILTLQATYEGLSFETSFTVTKSYAGQTGTPGTTIEVSSPDSTTPETNMVYDNSYYGMYDGQWYMWTWDSETTGYWTLTSATVPTDAVIHYSFDDMPDLPDVSGADYYNDYFTSVDGWLNDSGGILTADSGMLKCVASTSAGCFIYKNLSASQGNIVHLRVMSSVVIEDIQIKTDSTTWKKASVLKKITDYEWIVAIIFSRADNDNLVIYLNRQDGVSDKTAYFKEIYIGDGATKQPIIDNVSGSHNATASGLVSAQGVSGKCAHFLELQASSFDLSDYANVQSWWHSRWIYIDYTEDASLRDLWYYGVKDYASISDSTESGTSNILIKSNNGAVTFSVIVQRADIMAGWHHLTVQTIIASTTSTTKKVYLDGVLYTSGSSTLDYTNMTFNTSCFNGGATATAYVMNGYQDDFMFGVGEISDSDVLGLYLARGNTAKYYLPSNSPAYRGVGELISPLTKIFTGASVDDSGTITEGSRVTDIVYGDWFLGYTESTSTASVYYWSGTTWTATTEQKYVSAAAYDILNLTTGGYTVANYTVIVNAIIKNLMVSNMQLLSGGKIFSGTGTYGNSNTPIFLGYDTDGTAKFSLGNGLTFNGTDMAISTGGDVTFSGNTNINGDLFVDGDVNFKNLDLSCSAGDIILRNLGDFSASDGGTKTVYSQICATGTIRLTGTYTATGEGTSTIYLGYSNGTTNYLLKEISVPTGTSSSFTYDIGIPEGNSIFMKIKGYAGSGVIGGGTINVSNFCVRTNRSFGILSYLGSISSTSSAAIPSR